jgi:hypothetical protein
MVIPFQGFETEAASLILALGVLWLAVSAVVFVALVRGEQKRGGE